MPSTVPAQVLDEAKRLLKDGRPAEARTRLVGHEKADGASDLLARCQDLILRKHLRQAKADAFAAEAKGQERYRLALARLQGPQAVAALATDATASAADRELAAWISGDLRAGLGAMRRRPGWQALAEGWLRGDPVRARESFIKARQDQPRRAALGEGVALAVAGDLGGAETLLRHLGPFPQSVYPATAALLRGLSRHAAGWHPAALRDILRSDDLAACEKALAACPGDRHEERAWLLLRIGDLRAAATPPQARADEAWAQAGGLWPALMPDALKRRFWYALKLHQEDIPHLERLHAHLAGQDAAQAREALLTICAALNDSDLLHIQGPHRTCRTANDAVKRLPAEWLLAWGRCMAFALHLHAHQPQNAAAFHRQTGLARPPAQWKEWKSVMARLLAELPGEPQVTTLRLAILDRCRQVGERRNALFDALVADPERRDELLPRWCQAALLDRRSLRQADVEGEQLSALFAGDLRLVLARLHLTGMRYDAAAADRLRERLLPTLPGQHAAFVTWMHAGGPLPADLLGHDDLCDEMVLLWAKAKRTDILDEVRRRLCIDTDRFLRLLTSLGKQQPTLAHEEAASWRKRAPSCWQAHYACGLFVLLADPRNADARFHCWESAVRLAPPEAPETAAMRDWLRNADPWADPFDDDGEDGEGDEDDEWLEKGDEDTQPFDGQDPLYRKMLDDLVKRLADPRAQHSTPRKRQNEPTPPPAAPRETPIDLAHVALAADCQNELTLAGLPQLTKLTESESGPGPLPAYHDGIADEVVRLKRLAPYLRARIRDKAHRTWFDQLMERLSLPSEHPPF